MIRLTDKLAVRTRAQIDQTDYFFADPKQSENLSITPRIFILAGVGFAALAVFVVWATGGFAGLSAAGIIALTLGILFTAALGIGLMGLAFFSDRSGRDEAVDRAGKR